MRALTLAAALVFAGACGDNVTGEQPPPKDAPTPDAAPDAPPPGALGPCLDHPTNLPQPGGQLPCELIPPNAAFAR
ncbi:MAG: hypothetical protein KF773_34485 [Deltaproteobacteria bacterium]|nr:hypothetical protein [Deltaproteobacteria bacterium]MCW5804460.1 hypothetical protein [Deltaproteobacteria bacterium]